MSDSPQPPPSDSPLTPLAALWAHVAANPEDPCVFFPDRLGDWRWKPWRWLLSEASRWAVALREIEPGANVGYRWRPTPEVVAADLGIQLAGATAVPVTEGDEAAVPKLAAWLPVADEPPPQELSAPVVERTLDEAYGNAADRERRAAVGGVLVRKSEGWQRWLPADLATAAAVLARPAQPRERPIALVAGDLAAAEERAWLAWALTAGAALVLPGDPAFAAWAIFWPRPTDVCLPAGQLPAVRELFDTLGTPRIQRSRLKRIRRLLAYGGEPSSDEATAWQALGVSPTSWQLPSP